MNAMTIFSGRKKQLENLNRQIEETERALGVVNGMGRNDRFRRAGLRPPVELRERGTVFSGNPHNRAVLELITPELAHEIRKLRVGEGCSWKEIAEYAAPRMHFEVESRRFTLAGTHFPVSQLFGMSLCEIAAAHHGEKSNREPWML